MLYICYVNNMLGASNDQRNKLKKGKLSIITAAKNNINC